MTAAQRVVSLDILRGLTVIGMIVVNAAAGLQRFAIPAPLLHSHWIGLTFADLVFPAFIFMVGVSIAISMPQSGLDPATARRIAIRSLRLIAIGLLLTNIYWLADYDTNAFRWGGVLQRIGIVFLVAALLHLQCSTRTLIVLCTALLIGYCGLCFLPVPDGTAIDLHVPGANFVAWVDRAVFGIHLYVHGPKGYDPEGLLSTLPAIAQGCLGVVAGRQISQPAVMKRFAICGLLLMLVAAPLAAIVPVCKDLWSASFVLLTSGIVLIALGVLHELADVRGLKLPLAGIAAAFGVNAIAAYVLHYVTAGVLNWKIMDAMASFGANLLGARVAFVLPLASFLAAIAWAMVALRKRGWVIRV